MNFQKVYFIFAIKKFSTIGSQAKMLAKNVFILLSIGTFYVFGQIFSNDYFLTSPFTHCNKTTLNESKAALDMCYTNKSAGVIMKILQRRGEPIKPTRMRCRALAAWLQCANRSMIPTGCFSRENFLAVRLNLIYYNLFYSLIAPKDYGGETFIEDCPFVRRKTTDFAHLVLGSSDCDGDQYVQKMRKTIKCENGKLEEMEREAEFANGLPEQDVILTESLCYGYDYIQKTCWPLMTACMSDYAERRYQQGQNYQLRAIEQEARQNGLQNFSFSASCNKDN